MPCKLGAEIRPLFTYTWRCCWYLLTALAALAPLSLMAAESSWGSVTWQNDLLAGKDGGGYSNGTFGTYYHFNDQTRALTQQAPALTQPLLWTMPASANTTLSAHTVGQIMVTPRDITQSQPDPSDVAYGGLLFWRSGITAVQGDHADTAAMTLGIVGPLAGAEQTQKFVHKLVGAREPQGWDHQLSNELVFQLSRHRAWRLWRTLPSGNDINGLEADVIMTLDANLGTLASGVGSGVLFRLGAGLDNSFASSALLGSPLFAPANVGAGWNIYVGFGMNLLLNHIFVNGNTFNSSPSIPMKKRQTGMIAGFSYSWDRLSLLFTAEDAGALATPYSSRQRFGSLILAWRLE